MAYCDLDTLLELSACYRCYDPARLPDAALGCANGVLLTVMLGDPEADEVFGDPASGDAFGE